jgi:hypothetical protein
LIDAFFTRLVRNRMPHGAHQFVAYLTKLLNWNLILTTNFDDLIEMALRAEGLTPTVYELVRDEMPDHKLVESQLSVMKLHGGGFNLRAGLDLRQPMSEEQLETFLGYLPADAVMFVLGYGGGDRRVMDTLAAAAGKLKKLIWVHRDVRPPSTVESLKLNRKVATFSYQDGALFLQELYLRSNLSYPASRSHYRLLHSVPEVQSQAVESPIGSALIQPRAGVGLVVLYSPNDGQHLRQTMIQACRELEGGGYQHLWFNLYEFSSLNSFLSVMLEELRRLDRSLPPLILSPAADSQKRWYAWMAEALRRSKYLVAIDGVRAFRNTHPADANADASTSESARLDDLLRSLSTQATAFGESVVVVSGSSNVAPTLNGVAGVDLKEVPTVDCAVEASPAARAQKIWDGAGPWESAVLTVASAFRRPRGLVGLVRLAARLVPADLRNGIQKDSAPAVDVDWDSIGPAQRAFGERSALYLLLEGVVEKLVRDGALIRQEGGFYSMDPLLRNAMYSLAVKCHDADQLHHDIADYYRVVVYQQSKDFRAYCEYVFHRTASATGNKALRRIGWFARSLDKERDYVIGRGHASSLLDILETVDFRLRSLGQEDPPVRELQSMLTKLRRLVASSAGDYNTSVSLLKERIETCLAAAAVGLPRPGPPNGADGVWLSKLERCARFVPGNLNQLLWLLEIIELLIESTKVLTSYQVVADIEGITDVAKETLRSCANELTEQGDDLLGEDEVSASVRDARRLLRASALVGLMDLELRGINPWDADLTTTQDRENRNGIVKRHYDDAIELLRDARQGGRWFRLQTLLRCLAARAAFLSGHFSQANHELNRAHAFAAQPQGQHDYLALAIYWLHRAEYCMLHVMSVNVPAGTITMTVGGMKSLLESAAAALGQAEQGLLNGRRDVAWWGRLYILKARLQVLVLKDIQRDRDEELVRNNSSSIIGTPDRDGDYRRRMGSCAIEHGIVRGLAAVAGGLANIHEHPQREALLDEIWDELGIAAAGAAQRCPYGDYVNDASFAQLWEELNDRAALHAYWCNRKQRRETATLQIDIRSAAKGAVPSWAVDVSDGGIGLRTGENTPEKGDTLAVILNGLQLSGRVRHVTGRRVGVAWEKTSLDTRVRLASILRGLQSRVRNRRERATLSG